MWTLMGGDDKGGLEAIGIVADLKRESKGHIDTSMIVY